MTGDLLREVRIEQSCRRIDRLMTRADEWIGRRRGDDKVRQYATQFDVLRKAVVEPLGELRELAVGLRLVHDTGKVYAACRVSDTRTEVVRKVFAFYQERFDQRHDQALGPVLRAADEVVWSCWAEPFRSAMDRGQAVTMQPAPLPYIEPGYSPAAVPRDDPPSGLGAAGDDAVLLAYLRQLPIPLIALPAVCADDPWWLSYVGHEAGHHLQHDLVADWGLVKAFGGLVETASRAVGDADPQTWRRWGAEIFADICSVYAMGPAAVYGIVQLELDVTEKMMLAKAAYPPPLVRLGLMAAVAGQLGIDVASALEPAGLDVASLPQSAVIAAVATATGHDPLAGRGPFATLFDWDQNAFAPGGTVGILKEGLRERQPLWISRDIRMARLLTAASVTAWEEIAAISDPHEREDQRARLATRYLAAVMDSREEVTRDAGQPPPGSPTLQDDLTRLLVESIPDDGGS